MVLTAYLLTLIFIWAGLSAEPVVPPCDKDMFDSNVHICLSDFNNSMETSSYRDRCPWPTVQSIYNELKICVDDWANISWCSGWEFLVDEVFLEVHEKYFLFCGQVQDPPLTTLIMIIAPSIIVTVFIPFLCLKLNTWDTDIPSTHRL